MWPRLTAEHKETVGPVFGGHAEVWRRNSAAARLPRVVHFVGFTTKNGPNSPEVFSWTQPFAAVDGPVVQFRV